MMEKSNVPYDTISRLSVSSQTLFNKCCCCIPLRIGCFILGYLNLVINTFQSLGLVLLTTLFGVASHGFDHFDKNPGDVDVDEDIDEKPVLQTVGFILIVILVASLIWLTINIVCLVGLHKKKSGPIRVYVGFATTRLMLSIGGFIYAMMYRSENVDPLYVIAHSLDLGLTAYFILVYYIYSCRLEKEREQELIQPIQNAYIYPTILDEKKLVA